MAVPFILFVKKCLGPCMGISFVGMCAGISSSTAIVYSGGFAQRGQCPMGWFYGFKLRLICDEKSGLLNFMVTPVNVDDRESLHNKSFVEQIFGKLVGG